MIQRIQSAYLLLVVALMGATMGMPLGTFVGETTGISTLYAYELDIVGGQQDSACWGLFAIALLATIIAFATIFLFKNRKLQMRLTLFNILVTIGWYAAFAAVVVSYGKLLTDTAFVCASGAVLPLVAIILDVLAIRGIRHDERLVKAADRLR